MAASNEPFYLRYYSGHSGRFGHEFLEFDFRSLGDGRSASARYANNSNYRNDSLIRKEMCVSSLMIAQIKHIIKESEIMKEDDSKWPEKNKDGRQELEIRLGNEHISFETAKIGSLVDVTESADPEGLRVFYYLVQDLKALVFSLISLHFKGKPTSYYDSAPFQNEDRSSLGSNNAVDSGSPRQEEGPPTDPVSPTLMGDSRDDHLEQDKMPGAIEEYQSGSDGDSPVSLSGSDAASPESKENEQISIQSLVPPETTTSSSYSSTSLDDGVSSIRLLPNHTSSYLRHGSKFEGTQQSDKQNYKVEVDIKHVDMADSFLCGYLRIEGLTDDHPTLTTYFEGEIIGPKYTFQTRHASWGATDKTDMHHWARFPAWRPLAKQAKKPDFHYKNCAQRENIFMRWKESFLVPDHRVREISGASFEGFYYICFNQVMGTISGIYFHAKSEKYQQLELKHVEDKGSFCAMEFR
ncbi:MAG: hypothetical protein Q9190_001132 [Brigantiaea leucoxantha]